MRPDICTRLLSTAAVEERSCKRDGSIYAPIFRTVSHTIVIGLSFESFVFLAERFFAAEDRGQGRARRAVRPALTPVRGGGMRRPGRRSVPLLGKLDGRQVPQRAVWPLFVVLISPARDLVPRVGQVTKPAGIQALVSQSCIEAFHVAVLHRSPRLHVNQLDLPLLVPAQEMP